MPRVLLVPTRPPPPRRAVRARHGSRRDRPTRQRPADRPALRRPGGDGGRHRPGRPRRGAPHQENVVLVHAPDERSARERVERRARDAETSYLDDRRQTVGRRLKAVVDVREAEDTDLTEDADLYTRRFRDWAAYERVGPLLSRDDDPA
ncbi:DUF4288 domain-containing protein [Streptomyces pharetrae]|uniref:DUF4288 domain-containing protein n=1 Tax=Streptomyces pharetrae TaxID=291370 RepID=UPI00335E37F5